MPRELATGQHGVSTQGPPTMPGLQPGDMAPSPSTPSPGDVCLARVKPAKGVGGRGDWQGGGNPERWWAKPGQDPGDRREEGRA